MSTTLLPLLMFGLPGGGEIIVILVVGLLIFGGKLPEVARNIGKGIQEFKRGLADLDREVAGPMRDAMRIEPPSNVVPYQPPTSYGDKREAKAAADAAPAEEVAESPAEPAVESAVESQG